VTDKVLAGQATNLGAIGEINSPVGGAYRGLVPQFTSGKLGDCAQAHLPRLSPVGEERVFPSRWHAHAAVVLVVFCYRIIEDLVLFAFDP